MTRARGGRTSAGAARAMLLRVLPAALLLAFAAAPPAAAQAPAPPLHVAAATLRQGGEQLQFGLRFDRVVPVRELQPRRGRTVCVVPSPDRPSRRRGRVGPLAVHAGRAGRRPADAAYARGAAAAVKRAAERVGGGVRVIDLARVFTPGGRFRQTITFRGRTINARQADGVHLATSGARVAATLIVDRLRADRALP